MRYFISLLLLLFIYNAAYAQERKYPKKIYTAIAIDQKAPHIDGILDDLIWQKCSKGGNFVQHDPYDGEAPSQETSFAICYDDDHLYLAIWAYDSHPDSISQRMSRRDQIEGDMAGIELDSYHDKRTSYQFYVSASGVKLDRTQADGPPDETWDPVWLVKTAVNDEGWTAEFKIPFTQLRFSEEKEKVWGLEIGRYLFRKQEASIWQPIPKDAGGWVHLYGELHGIKNIKPKRQMNITPFVVSGFESHEKEEGNPYRPGKRGILNAGLDGKIGLSSNFTLDFTINPDFGQVEADPSELNLTAFETFFEERRPFFIEGKNIFNFPLTIGDGDMGNQILFYSRRIGRRPQHYPDLEDDEYAKSPEFTKILGAAKISGRTKNGLSVGVLESVTTEEHAEIDYLGEKRNEVVEPMTNYFVARVQKDYDEGNTQIGGMITSVNRRLDGTDINFLHKSAYTGGLDFVQYFKNKSYILSVKTYFSQVNGSTEALLETQTSSAHYYQRPDVSYVQVDSTRTSMFGNGGTIMAGRVGNSKLQYAGFMVWKTPGVHVNDLGFLPSGDDLTQVVWGQYRFTEPFSVFRSLMFDMAAWNVLDFGWRHRVYGANLNTMMQFSNYWSLRGMINYDAPELSTHLLRGGPAFRKSGVFISNLNLSSDERKKFSIGLNGFSQKTVQDYIDMKTIGLSMNYRPINTLNLSLEPSYTHITDELQYIDELDYDDEKRYIFGGIIQNIFRLSFRLNYSITPDLSVQYWGQPFIAAGTYKNFKYITNPVADRFEDRFAIYDEQQIHSYPEEEYSSIDEDRDGSIDYYIDYPDFNFKEFRSNLVIRWEFLPGSIAYLVWSQNRNRYDEYGMFRFGQDLQALSKSYPTNVIMLKLSYRIGN